MGKICECCGRNCDGSNGGPMYLDSEKVLCWECALPIRNIVENLYNLRNNKEMFASFEQQILERCKENYNENITELVKAKINAIEKKPQEKDMVSDNISVGVGVGTQIKAIASVILMLGMIASVILGFGFMVIAEEVAFLGLVVILLGCLMSWLSTICLRGFGQLVENSDTLVELAKRGNNSK